MKAMLRILQAFIKNFCNFSYGQPRTGQFTLAKTSKIILWDVSRSWTPRLGEYKQVFKYSEVTVWHLNISYEFAKAVVEGRWSQTLKAKFMQVFWHHLNKLLLKCKFFNLKFRHRAKFCFKDKLALRSIQKMRNPEAHLAYFHGLGEIWQSDG